MWVGYWLRAVATSSPARQKDKSRSPAGSRREESVAEARAILQQAGKPALCQIFRADGKAPDAFPGRRENGVAHGRGNDRQAGLADSSGLFLAHHHVDFRFRSFVDARHLLIVEIRLLDAPIFDVDGVVQSGGKTVDAGAHELSTDAVRIDGTAAIDRVN